MPDQKQPTEPQAADADTLLRALEREATKRGWVRTSAQVDAEGSVLVSFKVKPDEEA